MTLLVLVGLVACDDQIFPATYDGDPIVGDTYADVVAVFEGGCVTCHGASGPSGGLDLVTDPCATIVDVTASNYTGVRVAPGDSGASVLWNKMAETGTYGGVMPLAGALPSASVETVAAWIDAGAACGDGEDTGTADAGGVP